MQNVLTIKSIIHIVLRKEPGTQAILFSSFLVLSANGEIKNEMSYQVFGVCFPECLVSGYLESPKWVASSNTTDFFLVKTCNSAECEGQGHKWEMDLICEC